MKKSAVSIADLSSMTDGASQSLSYGCTAALMSFDPTSGYFTFNTHCSTSSNSWDQELQFINWAALVPEDLQNQDWDQIKQAVPDIVNSDVRVHCSCPAFTYWGHAYNLTNEDGALHRNDIAPSLNDQGYYKRDPDERHSCKHLVAIYNSFFR
jgi:hypothetical protein